MRFLRASPQVTFSGCHTQSTSTEGVGEGKEEALFCYAMLLFPPVFWLHKHTHYLRNCYCYLSDAE